MAPLPAGFALRPAEQADGTFLAEMVVEAANWSQGAARPRHVILEDPGFARYVTGWKRPADAGVIAMDAQGHPVGGAWFRMLPRTEPGFGYVGTGVPELVIGVRAIWRAHGVGRTLLQQLCDLARTQGFGRISLSVERGNFARTLYRSEGFAVTEAGNGRDTMVKRLR